MDRGAWRATAHGVTKSWTRLSDYHSLTQHLAKVHWAALARMLTWLYCFVFFIFLFCYLRQLFQYATHISIYVTHEKCGPHWFLALSQTSAAITTIIWKHCTPKNKPHIPLSCPTPQHTKFSSVSWWWTGRPGVLQFMGSQRVGHDWATELNWSRGMVKFADVNLLS